MQKSKSWSHNCQPLTHSWLTRGSDFSISFTSVSYISQSVSHSFSYAPDMWNRKKPRVWCIKVLPYGFRRLRDTTFQIVPLSNHLYRDKESLIVRTEVPPSWMTTTGFCSRPWAAPVSSTDNWTPRFQEPHKHRSRYTPEQPEPSLSQRLSLTIHKTLVDAARTCNKPQRQPWDSEHHLMA